MKNKFVRLTLFLILAFAIDSTITYFVPYRISNTFEYVSSVGVLMFAYIVNTISSRHQYGFALAVGLYYSIIYANSQFIYVWLFLIDTYVINNYIKTRKISFWESIVIAIMLVSLHQLIPFAIYTGFSMTTLSLQQFFLIRYLPTVAGNLIVGIGVYLLVDHLKTFEVDQTFY